MGAERPRRWTRGARALTVASLGGRARAPRRPARCLPPWAAKRDSREAGAIRSSALALNP